MPASLNSSYSPSIAKYGKTPQILSSVHANADSGQSLFFIFQVCNISFEPTEETIFLRRGKINVKTVALNEYLLDWGEWNEEEVGRDCTGSRSESFAQISHILSAACTVFFAGLWSLSD